MKHSERAKTAALNADVEAEGQLIDLGMKRSNFTPDMMFIIKEAAQKSVIPKWAERAGGYESEPVGCIMKKSAQLLACTFNPMARSSRNNTTC